MCGNTKERCMPTSRSSSPIFWHGGCVVDFPTTPINSCTSTSKCSFHRKASRRAASHTLTSAFTLLYLSLLVLTLAVQVVAISNLKPAVAAVPAQAIQAPSAQNVLAGFQLFVCIGSLRLGQRPTWDLSPSDKFNSTLGYPGEGPVLNAGASMPMSVDVQAVVSNLPTPATPEAARGPSVGSNTAISPLPVIDAAEEAKIANTVGLAAFESLWDEMACKISGNRSAGYKLSLKCNCATKREQISFRVPVDKP